MKVDGFHEQSSTVFEFQGCYYHGCVKCFPYQREEPLKEDPSNSLHQRFQRTKAKIEKLKESGHEIVEMWECEFTAMKKRLKLNHLNSLPILNTLPLNPRDSFYGGRTGNTKTYHACAEGEVINYVDVCSLYPWVCKYGKYPIGHPTVYVGDRECRQRGMDVEGLLKCKVLPPRNLYHPVLPARMNGKLMFVLCNTCGRQMEQSDCEHNSDERVLVGTWTMDELRKAVSKGYVILEMYELWEYEVATFERGGLFTDFINSFLKIKQEATGYPSWCTSDEHKVRYVEDYFVHEGIRLDPAKIQKNAGLRSLAKLILNSFWGFFGMRENLSKTSVIRNSKDLFNMMISPGIEINTMQIINEEVLLVNWQFTQDVGDPLPNTNVVLASYTTSQARLKLYSYLETLETQVLYYDTDSVIYSYQEGQQVVPTGDYLGEMTDELSEYGPGSYIKEFVSGGPKTYAYTVFATNNPQVPSSVCKIKGLTLNFETSKIINFEVLKRMVLEQFGDDDEDVREPFMIHQNRIRRTKDRDLITISEAKIFKITGPKRKLDGDYGTLPYGFSKR